MIFHAGKWRPCETVVSQEKNSRFSRQTADPDRLPIDHTLHEDKLKLELRTSARPAITPCLFRRSIFANNLTPRPSSQLVLEAIQDHRRQQDAASNQILTVNADLLQVHRALDRAEDQHAPD